MEGMPIMACPHQKDVNYPALKDGACESPHRPG
jgi:hypothetical protein